MEATQDPSMDEWISQEMGATWIFANRWTDKHNMVRTYNRILFSLEKRGNSDVYYNMDEPWGHYAKWNKPAYRKTNNIWF